MNTVWACAMVDCKNKRLFTTLTAAAEQKMQDFNWQVLTKTAWAFATVGHKKAQLLTALAAVAE